MLIKILLSMMINVAPGVLLMPQAITISEDLRSVYSGKITITSNYRSSLTNKNVGGVLTSRHLCGQAVDIRLRGLTNRDILDILKLETLDYDVIIESDHIHIETNKECK